ncbi:sugar phosphate isomerase/epimerase [Catalinimonas sp. 4WD22]|uniref:sugar phosphate isomerase/epimerase family protein n=1 Tax=Catalinimonas locisalis TaxID=3133978 RepID=UPI00310132F1
MQKRRDFLKNSLLAAGTLGLSDLTEANLLAKKIEVGIITNTMRSEFAQDYRQALQALADIGYTHIEGGVPESCKSATAFKAALDEQGLQSVSLGSSMGNLMENMDNYLQTADTLETPYLACYWPWLSSAENLGRDEVMEAAERINTVGKRAKEAGLRFAWHNHDKEFVEVDGQLAFDMLMENTDPDYTTVQLDWYWVVKGGQDPVAYFRKYPGRFELAHVKDMNNNRDGGISCVGQGIIDFDSIFANADTGGVKHFIVENERAVRGLDCAKVSYQSIHRILSK